VRTISRGGTIFHLYFNNIADLRLKRKFGCFSLSAY